MSIETKNTWLTDDAWKQVFSFLDRSSLVNCSVVCKKWSGLIKNILTEIKQTHENKRLEGTVAKTATIKWSYESTNILVGSSEKIQRCVIRDSSLLFSNEKDSKVYICEIPSGNHVKTIKAPWVISDFTCHNSALCMLDTSCKNAFVVTDYQSDSSQGRHFNLSSLPYYFTIFGDRVVSMNTSDLIVWDVDGTWKKFSGGCVYDINDNWIVSQDLFAQTTRVFYNYKNEQAKTVTFKGLLSIKQINGHMALIFNDRNKFISNFITGIATPLNIRGRVRNCFPAPDGCRVVAELSNQIVFYHISQKSTGFAINAEKEGFFPESLHVFDYIWVVRYEKGFMVHNKKEKATGYLEIEDKVSAYTVTNNPLAIHIVNPDGQIKTYTPEFSSGKMEIDDQNMES